MGEPGIVGLNLDAILFSLVSLTIDQEIQSFANIKLTDILCEAVVLDLGKTNEILEAKPKPSGLMLVQLVRLQSEVEKLFQFAELMLCQLILQLAHASLELLLHNLKDLTLVEHATQRSIDLLSHHVVNHLIHLVENLLMRIGLEVHRQVSELQDERRIYGVIAFFICKRNLANLEIFKTGNGYELIGKHLPDHFLQVIGY